METDRPDKTAVFLARDPEGKQAITALVKHTYVLGPRGTLDPAPDPMDFVDEDEVVAKGDEPGSFPVAETEMVPFKLRTDFVVTGDIVTLDERPLRSLLAGVRVGPYGKGIQVFGERMIEVRPDNTIAFTDPEPFTTFPLSYARAYGGVDPSVPRNEDPKTAAEWIEYLSLLSHPGVYPRNPVGRAYVVNPHVWLLNQRPLPNFEDPNDLLTPERILVRDPRAWWRQPMPAGTGWFGRGWYPRGTMAGLLPPFPPTSARPPR